jgi:hypothetical protein
LTVSVFFIFIQIQDFQDFRISLSATTCVSQYL